MGYPAARAQLSHLREPQGRYQGPNGSIIERIPPFQSTPLFLSLSPLTRRSTCAQVLHPCDEEACGHSLWADL